MCIVRTRFWILFWTLLQQTCRVRHNIRSCSLEYYGILDSLYKAIIKLTPYTQIVNDYGFQILSFHSVHTNTCVCHAYVLYIPSVFVNICIHEHTSLFMCSFSFIVEGKFGICSNKISILLLSFFWKSLILLNIVF